MLNFLQFWYCTIALTITANVQLSQSSSVVVASKVPILHFLLPRSSLVGVRQILLSLHFASAQ
jgi:hypothetical protein